MAYLIGCWRLCITPDIFDASQKAIYKYAVWIGSIIRLCSGERYYERFKHGKDNVNLCSIDIIQRILRLPQTDEGLPLVGLSSQRSNTMKQNLRLNLERSGLGAIAGSSDTGRRRQGGRNWPK